MPDSWINQIAGLHLVNQNGTPIAGGDPRLWYTSPFGVGEGFAALVAKPKTLYGGGAPFAYGARPRYSSYDNVRQSIPITVVGTDADNAAQLLQLLKLALMAASYSTPCIWRMRAGQATNDIYAEIYEASVQEKADLNEIGPAEGGYQLEAEIEIVRSPFFGADTLMTLIDAQTFTNTSSGNVISLGDVFGDLAYEGQPLNIQINKPTSQSAASVILATVHQRLSATVNEAKTNASTTTPTAYTLTSSLDASALRERDALETRIIARFKTLTAPSKAKVRATIQTAGGGTLWVGKWVRLSTNTTAQLADLGGAPLDAVKIPLASTINLKILVELLSSDGTSVTATLDYVELLLMYDLCVVELTGGLAAGQHYELLGASNRGGGGYQPMIPEGSLSVDASLNPIAPARIRGSLVRGFSGASLYVAWYDSGRAHTDTDTAAVTVKMAPLWRTLRGIT